MTSRFTLVPSRRRGIEYLDDLSMDPALVTRSLSDVARANRFLGGTRAVSAELAPLFADAKRRGDALTVLDVGTGLGDISARAQREATALGLSVTTIGVEITLARAAASRPAGGLALAADAMTLPFADHSVDIVTCSQVLHHFDDAAAQQLLAEMHRVARLRVIVSDLRRAWFAAGGLWLVSWLLGFHPVSRHDGVVSILRGFTRGELTARVLAATGRRATVTDRPLFRVTASWSPA